MASQQPSRQQPTLRSGWEQNLTDEFRRLLSTKRMSVLSRTTSHRASSPATHFSRISSFQTSSSSLQLPPRHGSGAQPARSPMSSLDNFTLGAPPPVTRLNIPLIPQAPMEASHQRFRTELQMLSETPCRWENPGLLDGAMTSIPLDRIYSAATEETQLLQATAESMGKKAAWAWQDCVIRALMKWFKREFFVWINNPTCARCGGPTVARSTGYGAPTQEERALGANQVELYDCSNCGACERFARYNDAFVLLQTRKGRLGEWVNCFGMLCRAMGSRVRWVWSSEDHVWTEVYSEYRKRWVHVDACEGAFDKPTLYTEGWKKSLRYCIAFSADGAMDVTNRYCRNPVKYGMERNRVPEAVLLFILDEIRSLRRRDKNKEEKFALEGEDARESRELRHYYVSSLTAEVAKLVAPAPSRRPADPDAQKAAESRQNNTSTQQARSRNQSPRDTSRNGSHQPPR